MLLPMRLEYDNPVTRPITNLCALGGEVCCLTHEDGPPILIDDSLVDGQCNFWPDGPQEIDGLAHLGPRSNHGERQCIDPLELGFRDQGISRDAEPGLTRSLKEEPRVTYPGNIRMDHGV